MVEQPSGLTALGALLSSIGASPRADTVVVRILEAISIGAVAYGEQLPNEVDLATQLGVSPMTLRRALAELRRRGLVETKRGRSGGSFVRASGDLVNSLAHQRLLEMTVQDLRDLGDEHCAIAGAAASLAARRAVAGEAVELRRLTQCLLSSADPMHSRYADSRFHIEVSMCSQSARLTRAEEHLQAELSPLKWLPQLGVEAKAEGARHLALVEAIEDGDEQVARSLAENHSSATTWQLVALRAKLPT